MVCGMTFCAWRFARSNNDPAQCGREKKQQQRKESTAATWLNVAIAAFFCLNLHRDIPVDIPAVTGTKQSEIRVRG